jgi:hypothetical protein
MRSQSSFPLQVFVNNSFFVRHKKASVGRFFTPTKNRILLQKAFHFNLGYLVNTCQLLNKSAQYKKKFTN